jgi:hypothetical protein
MGCGGPSPQALSSRAFNTLELCNLAISLNFGISLPPFRQSTIPKGRSIKDYPAEMSPSIGGVFASSLLRGQAGGTSARWKSRKPILPCCPRKSNDPGQIPEVLRGGPLVGGLANSGVSNSSLYGGWLRFKEPGKCKLSMADYPYCDLFGSVSCRAFLAV